MIISCYFLIKIKMPNLYLYRNSAGKDKDSQILEDLPRDSIFYGCLFFLNIFKAGEIRRLLRSVGV